MLQCKLCSLFTLVTRADVQNLRPKEPIRLTKFRRGVSDLFAISCVSSLGVKLYSCKIFSRNLATFSDIAEIDSFKYFHFLLGVGGTNGRSI